MSQHGHSANEPARRRINRIPGASIPAIAVGVGLLGLATTYFVYDVVTQSTSPCESIFRQTAVSLDSKMSFLKSHGLIHIGHEPIVELSERAQMTALNLKTCCTVLHAGKVDPEQFLQCKAKARDYETQIDDIVTAVKKLPEPATPSSGAAVAAVAPPEQIQKKVSDAKAISKSFNKRIVEVRREQALQSLELAVPKAVDVEGQESEPNNDSLNTNVIKTDVWVKAAITPVRDSDYFVFTTPSDKRDWITIEVDNRSTTLKPRVELYNSDKARVGEQYNTTAGGAVSYSFVAPPETRYSFRMSSYYGEQSGGYLVRVKINKSFDTFEPNGTILTATPISAGATVKASIMDGKDVDYFKVETPDSAKEIEIRIVNQSTTLRPRFYLYNSAKAQVGEGYNTTAGGDVKQTKKIAGGGAIYVRVSDYYGEVAGKYELSVSFKP